MEQTVDKGILYKPKKCYTFPPFSTKNVVGTHQRCLCKALVMSSHYMFLWRKLHISILMFLLSSAMKALTFSPYNIGNEEDLYC